MIKAASAKAEAIGRIEKKGIGFPCAEDEAFDHHNAGLGRRFSSSRGLNRLGDKKAAALGGGFYL
jgi:hypothetical protein